MEQIRISEMITACGIDSESSNIENVSVQNGYINFNYRNCCKRLPLGEAYQKLVSDLWKI